MQYISIQKSKKGFVKKFMAAFLAFAICFTSIPVFAFNGNLTFTHGNNIQSKRAFGRTTSTAVESNMRNELTVSFSDGSSYLRIGESKNSSICYVESDNLAGRIVNYSIFQLLFWGNIIFGRFLCKGTFWRQDKLVKHFIWEKRRWKLWIRWICQ